MQKTISFTLGCFDVLHIGHINLLENAKATCDYLIVGVLSDEYVEKNKEKRVFNIEDRIRILKSLKYCDAVIPEDILDKMTLWKKYKFDYLFVGSDWYDTPQYKKWEEELNEINCKVIYYPYTKGVCSSEVKSNSFLN